MHADAPIYVAGHRGMVGSALWRELLRRGFTNLIGKTRAELDLRDAAAVAHFFAAEKPQYVFAAAARVGGILANSESSGRLSVGKPPNPEPPHRKRAPGRRQKVALPWQFLHLPQTGPSTPQGRRPPHRPPRTHQPMVCRRQNRRRQTLPGLPPPIWLRFHFRHAHQSLRLERQL